MKLYLVQHAQAEAKKDDPKRPLTQSGWIDIKKMAIYLAEHPDFSVTWIYHSGKLRSEQTAQSLQEGIKCTGDISETDGLNPLDDPAIWAERIGESSKDIMLVGHLPHLSKLAAQLLVGDADREPVRFQNAGVICLERDETRRWTINWMVIPQIVHRTWLKSPGLEH